ncbi:Nucleoredoxin [Frankliniella fusca]|uniref:Nucleoredoxin n=1 Tax=Frankliniella fusca TaxID=407009 RepID=A0AAE1LV87_9NEOP|nr:Nucleoredoxin [Frankliniella fusca]
MAVRHAGDGRSRSEESFQQYASSMPWPAVSWADDATRQELASLLAVQGIPTLVLLDAKDCAVITDDARARVNDDPDGKDFPWRPEPVSLFTERLSSRLHDHPALILFVEGGPGEVEWAMSILRQAADVYEERHPASESALREPRLQFYVAQDVSMPRQGAREMIWNRIGDAADGLREQLVLEDTVPLLVAVDVWRGAVSVLEDEADDDELDEERDGGAGAISAASAVAFMEAFLAGDLPTAPIGVYLPPPPRPHQALLQDALPVEA